MIDAPIIKKVPGNIVKFGHEKDGYVSLTKLTTIELRDLLQREEKLANNTKFLNKLPDKGQKIKRFLEDIQREIKKRDEHEKLCDLLATLNVHDSKDALNRLEWTGEYEFEKKEVDGEDDVNPLKILATHSGTDISKEKQIKVQKSEELIKPSDCPEALDSSFDDIDIYAKQLCHRFDSNESRESKKRFYTNKPLKVASDEKSKINSTIPVSISETKMLSLEESIKIQQEQTKHLKEIEFLHAMEKLTNKKNINVGKPVSNIKDYREQAKYDSEDEHYSVSEDETEDDRESNTVVFYNLED